MAVARDHQRKETGSPAQGLPRAYAPGRGGRGHHESLARATCIRDASGRRLLIEKTFTVKADMESHRTSRSTRANSLPHKMSYIFPRRPVCRISRLTLLAYTRQPASTFMSVAWAPFEYADLCPRPLRAESLEAFSGKRFAYDRFVEPSHLDSRDRLPRDTAAVCARTACRSLEGLPRDPTFVRGRVGRTPLTCVRRGRERHAAETPATDLCPRRLRDD